jgi:hypothetical protein
MSERIRAWLAGSRPKWTQGTLTEADWDELESLVAEPRQQVLYLYSKSTNMRSPLAGWVLYDPTKPQEPQLPSDKPPYASVLDALADGWRVVQFPILKLYDYEGQDNDYLGYEFILERMA